LSMQNHVDWNTLKSILTKSRRFSEPKYGYNQVENFFKDFL